MHPVLVAERDPRRESKGAREAQGSPKGYKMDQGKLDYTLFLKDMSPEVAQIVQCLHWGHHTKGYPREGYKTLPGGSDRLLAACYRHMAAMSEDFWEKDKESGQPHVVHAITNLLMAMAQGRAQGRTNNQ